MSEKLEFSEQDGIHILAMDDGKANALDFAAVSALSQRIATARAEARAVVLLGRTGFLTAGLDNKTLQQGGSAAGQLLSAMGRLLIDLSRCEIPFVVGCTGHATAAGAMLLLVAHHRVAADGPFRIGFSEVGIGMPLPGLPIELARARLLPSALEAATAQATLFSPQEALRVGFVDRVVAAPALAGATLEAARALAALDRDAYKETLARVRAPWVATLEEQLTLQ